MNSQTSQNKFFPLLLILLGLLYVTTYVAFKSNETTKAFSGYLELVVMVATDIVAFIFGVHIWKKSVTASKRIFGFFALSFGFVVIDDIIYNAIYSVAQLPREGLSAFWLSSYNVPYLLFLVLQCLFWISILFYATKFSKFKSNASWVIPIAIIVPVLGFIYYLASDWKTGSSALASFYDISDNILAMGRFIFATLCLAVLRNKGLSYVSFGTVLAGVVDVILGFGFFTTYHAGSVMEAMLILTSLLQIYGLVIFIKSNDYEKSPETWVSEPEGIKAQTTFV